MPNDTPSPETLQQARKDIQGLMRQIAALSKQDLEVEDYFQQFLAATTAALGAAGGAVWKRNDEGDIELVTQMNLRTTEIAEGGEDELRHNQMLAAAMVKGEAAVLPPYSGSEKVGNPTRFLLLVVPLRSDDGVEGVVEIFQRPVAAIEVQRGYVKFLDVACDQAANWMRRRKYQQLDSEQSRWQALDQFSQAIHESLDIRATAYAVANEARTFIGCDRVSVATRRGSEFYLTSISGQATIDNRSNLVVSLQRLIRRVLAAGDPLWYAGSTDEMPPQLETALQEYVDLAHSKTIGIVPLRKVSKPQTSEQEAAPEPEIIGALVVEQIEDSRTLDTVQLRAKEVATHAARGIANAYDHESLFLMPLWRLIGKSRVLTTARNLPKTLLVAGGLLIAVLVCLLVPIRFDLEGTAELQPIQRRDVFASMQGIVSEVHVDTGERVEVGDKVLTLRNTELNVRIEDLEGRLSVVGEQLREYERQFASGAAASPAERARIGSEMASLRKQQANFMRQLDYLDKRKNELTIVSPIAGEVITWDARRLLQNRPVTPGQVLLTIADTEDDWELLIHMPEDNIGYISDSQHQIKEDLDVSYVLATSPGDRLEGTLRSVHQLAEPHPTAGHTVKIAVEIEEDDLEHPRPGATATAQVHCGRRSIAFVWLHDVVEFLQTKVFF